MDDRSSYVDSELYAAFNKVDRIFSALTICINHRYMRADCADSESRLLCRGRNRSPFTRRSLWRYVWFRPRKGLGIKLNRFVSGCCDFIDGSQNRAPRQTNAVESRKHII